MRTPVFTIDDISERLRVCQSCRKSRPDAYSVYRGVFVVWDRDRDDRLLDVIDAMTDDDRARLVAAYEHKASVSFVWRDFVPEGYDESFDLGCQGDLWHIDASSPLPD